VIVAQAAGLVVRAPIGNAEAGRRFQRTSFIVHRLEKIGHAEFAYCLSIEGFSMRIDANRPLTEAIPPKR
jgi:hypothetical protein